MSTRSIGVSCLKLIGSQFIAERGIVFVCLFGIRWYCCEGMTKMRTRTFLFDEDAMMTEILQVPQVVPVHGTVPAQYCTSTSDAIGMRFSAFGFPHPRSRNFTAQSSLRYENHTCRARTYLAYGGQTDTQELQSNNIIDPTAAANATSQPYEPVVYGMSTCTGGTVRYLSRQL